MVHRVIAALVAFFVVTLSGCSGCSDAGLRARIDRLEQHADAGHTPLGSFLPNGGGLTDAGAPFVLSGGGSSIALNLGAQVELQLQKYAHARQSPAQIPGKLLWIDGDHATDDGSAHASALTDQSGAAIYSFAQSTSNLRPSLIAGPVSSITGLAPTLLHCNGSSFYLVGGTALPTSGSTMSVFFVGRTSVSQAVFASVLGKFKTAGTFALFTTGADLEFGVKGLASQGTTGPINDNAMRAVYGAWDGVGGTTDTYEASARTDRIAAATGTMTGGDQLTLCALANSDASAVSNYWQGDVGTLILFDHVLTQFERSILAGYAYWKYGIVPQLVKVFTLGNSIRFGSDLPDDPGVGNPSPPDSASSRAIFALGRAWGDIAKDPGYPGPACLNTTKSTLRTLNIGYPGHTFNTGIAPCDVPTLDNSAVGGLFDSDYIRVLIDVEGGTNDVDLATATDLASLKANAALVPTAVKAIAGYDASRVKIGINTISSRLWRDVGIGATAKEALRVAYNTALRDPATLHGLGYDFLVDFAGDSRLGDPNAHTNHQFFHSPDEVHMNPDGHAVWAQIIQKTYLEQVQWLVPLPLFLRRRRRANDNDEKSIDLAA